MSGISTQLSPIRLPNVAPGVQSMAAIVSILGCLGPAARNTFISSLDVAACPAETVPSSSTLVHQHCGLLLHGGCGLRADGTDCLVDDGVKKLVVIGPGFLLDHLAHAFAGSGIVGQREAALVGG